jgi:hypothetical protein
VSLTHAELKTRVWAELGKWQEPLGLNRWLLTINWGDEADGDGGYASCEPNPQYREATLTFNLAAIIDRGKVDQIEYIVVHELMHCHTAKLSNLCQWLWEKLLEVTEEELTSDLERLPLISDRIPASNPSPST